MHIKQKKYLVKIMMVVLGLVIGWYTANRLVSPWTVVKLTTLPPGTISFSHKPFTPLKVGCYNIAHGRGGQLGTKNWAGGNRTERTRRIKQIAQLLKSASLDIVVLNEVDFSSFWSGHINQARVVAKAAGYPYIVEQRNIDVAIPFISLRFGNAILSKYPISDVSFLDYPNTSEWLEILIGGFKEGVAGTVTLPDKTEIQVAAIHLSVKSEAIRVASAQKILSHQLKSGLPLLLMGDFNSSPKGYPKHITDKTGKNAIDILVKSNQVETILKEFPIPRETFTFPSEKPVRVIDWIFVSPSWQIEEYVIINTELSDHLPVTAVLARKNYRE